MLWSSQCMWGQEIAGFSSTLTRLSSFADQGLLFWAFSIPYSGWGSLSLMELQYKVGVPGSPSSLAKKAFIHLCVVVQFCLVLEQKALLIITHFPNGVLQCALYGTALKEQPVTAYGAEYSGAVNDVHSLISMHQTTPLQGAFVISKLQDSIKSVKLFMAWNRIIRGTTFSQLCLPVPFFLVYGTCYSGITEVAVCLFTCRMPVCRVEDHL